MKTKANESTNNFIVRVWSRTHYKSTDKNIYEGTISNVSSKETMHFHSAGELLRAIEYFDKYAEKERKINAKKAKI